MGSSKTKLGMGAVVMTSLVLPFMAQAGEWFPCGNLGQLSNCQLQAYPGLKYEYGIAYNSSTPLPIVCTTWNVGSRVYNKQPFLNYSDDPSATMNWGGFMFYTGTNAADDDACQSGTWRHRYWWLTSNNAVVTASSNGCINSALFCRLW